MSGIVGWCLVVLSIMYLVHYFSFSWIVFPVLLFVVFLASGGPSFPRVFFRTFYRDIRSFYIMASATAKVLRYETKQKHSIIEIISETVNKYPEKTAFKFEGQSWTFRELDEYSNRIANIFKSKGYVKGDVVALFMENRPEYIFIWLGLAKIGVISSLINFNLRLDSLLHCITVSNSKGLIFSSNYSDAVKAILHNFPDTMQFLSYGSGKNIGFKADCLDEEINDASSLPPVVNFKKSFKDPMLYIFTSGTTGLPKPALLPASRFYCMAHVIGRLYNIGPDDVMYSALPLYHSAAGAIGVSFCLLLGTTMVISKKFSASKCIEECGKYNATVLQYIGEMCRYLLAQPSRPTDAQHKIRLALGNGLRETVWRQFQSRFQIKQIGEMYGSTEGNIGILNVDNIVGSCGFIFALFPSLHPAKLIQIDPETGEIVRGKDGLARQCDPQQLGHFVGKVVEDNKSIFRLTGYLNKQETAKKIGRDVFSKGDCYFLSGDLVTKDEYGNIYFVDRTGDTFRWRGENVSTNEMESIIMKALGLCDVVVYGVRVPNAEGRAGMVAIADPDGLLDVRSLAEKLEPVVPTYARPIFVRVTRTLQLTGTFKFQKSKLKEEGFDVNIVKDNLYYYDSQSKSYLTLDENVYSKIINGKVRL